MNKLSRRLILNYKQIIH